MKFFIFNSGFGFVMSCSEEQAINIEHAASKKSFVFIIFGFKDFNLSLLRQFASLVSGFKLLLYNQKPETNQPSTTSPIKVAVVHSVIFTFTKSPGL